MAVLRTLIQQGDCEKALEYLNEVSQTYDDTVIVISPLLANIYLNTLDRLWEKY